MSSRSHAVLGLVAAAVIVALTAPAAQAQDKARTQVYGFAMTDVRYDREAIDPSWFDVMRPTKLAAFENQFGEEGSVAFSARQSRLGVKSFIPTDLGELQTTFEFEMFGVGVDAGQTTIRLRHAYGQLGKFGAGQTWSPFMDIDVFPNSIEYWGPNGMAFFRNVQFRYMPIQGDTRMTIAIERPGASADGGQFADRAELDDVVGRFPLPDVSAEYRYAGGWGYIEGAAIVRQIEWDDLGVDAFDLSGDATGWGLSLSSNLKAGNGVFRLQGVVGEGVQNYMNDAPVDIAVQATGDPLRPLEGVALPMVGAVAFLDWKWNDKWSTAVGYSMLDIDNSDGQAPSAFHRGHYALVNAMYTPVPSLMLGPELQWDKRENFSDGWEIDNVGVQFSAKYSFSTNIGGD